MAAAQLEQEMRSWAELHNVPIIAPASALQLAALAAEKQPRRILEVGCAIGYSALLLAEHSAADVQITTIEMDPQRAATARRFIAAAGKENSIRLIEGDAAAVIDSLDGPFDFVFLDGPKAQYLKELQQLLPDKLASHATIVADNVSFRGMVDGSAPCLPRYRTLVKRLREYVSFVSTDRRFATRIIASADHLAISEYSKELSANE